MRPLLEKTLDLSRRYADFFPGYEHIADPLIDGSDHGMTDRLGARPVRRAARARWCRWCAPSPRGRPPTTPACSSTFPRPQQLAFGARGDPSAIGYDFDARPAGQDAPPVHDQVLARRRAHHHARARGRPRPTRCSARCTSAGHALYEQGVAPRLEGTPLAEGTSAGVHESQSRLWENLVGRSRAFWEHFYPRLQPRSRRSSRPCRSTPSTAPSTRWSARSIRTDADEVTYNLHVMMRFDLELDLLEGRLAVKDLPEAWRARMQADLGVAPPDDRDGVLQDVHWYAGLVGGELPGLHARQHPERPVLRGRGAGAPGDPGRDRARRVRHAARLAAREHLPARGQVHGRRAGRARHRRRR